LSFKNSSTSYGSVAKFMHWTIATLFLVQYCLVYYRRQFTVDEELYADWVGTGNFRAFQLHAAIGITLFVFALLRLLWRWSNTQPAMPPGRGWEHSAAHLVHYSLYFMMIMMPVTGYLGTDGDTEYLGIPRFRTTALYDWLVTGKLGMDWATFEAPLDYIHRQIGGALVLWMLIALHAGAALYHHFIKRDEVLLRMIPGKTSIEDKED
jgi:cytochrome b561